MLASPQPIGDRDLVALAGRIGLDRVAFAQTLARHRYAARVEADLEIARARGIRGSPALLVNGNRLDGVPTLSTLTQYVEAELKARPAARLQRDQP